MKVQTFITNPQMGSAGTETAAQAQRSLLILVGSMVSGGLIAAALIFFVVELPIIALVVLLGEVAVAIFMLRTMPKSVAAKYPTLIVASSYLAGLEINQFAQPQQLWDAAIIVRDSGDRSRAQAILGS